MRYLSLFSGIEAASVAWEPLGWEPVAFCEVDAFPSAVLAHRWPHVPNLGDITKVDWSDFAKGKRKPDVVVGGSPCQSFSVAGNREGLAGESGLMFEYIRAVRCIMPRCFVWENVPGAFTSEDGEAFRQLLSEMDAIGYGLAWRVLDAQFFGVAQRRERVFLVGCLGDPRRAARVLFEPDGLRWDTPSSRDKRQELAARAGRGPAREGGAVAKTLQVRCGCEGGGKGALIQDDMSATLSTCQTQTVLAPTYQIAGNIIGRDPKNGGHQLGVVDPDDNGAFTLTTNDLHAVAAPVTRCGDVASTLTARCDSSPCADRGANVVVAPVYAVDRATTPKTHTDVFHTLRYGGAGGTNDAVAVPVCLADDNAKASCDVDMCGALKVGGSAPIVSAVGFDAWNSAGPSAQNGVAPTLTVGRAGDTSALVAYDVRRLMPVECERLQGFPDGHTDLTGADPDALFERMARDDMDEAERRKLRAKLRKWCKACPDTPRYKACGNSMAVPVMRWIGERIERIERAEVPL